MGESQFIQNVLGGDRALGTEYVEEFDHPFILIKNKSDLAD